MKNAPPIPPNLKAFLDDALPKGEGGHVLALGEMHSLKSHHRFLRQHFDELRDDHNVGTLGMEIPAFLDVLLWAYRDGNLPVPKEEESRYLTQLYQMLTTSKTFNSAMAERAPLLMDAIDHGLATINFDSRDNWTTVFQQNNGIIGMLHALFAKRPELRESILHDPDQVANVARELTKTSTQLSAYLAQHGVTHAQLTDTVQRSFVLLEINSLLLAHPIYAQHLRDTEIVIETGKRMGIDQDALSAALLASAIRPGNNAITQSGLMHLIGGSNVDMEAQGTFAQQLARMPLRVTTAVMASNVENGIMARHLLSPLIREELRSSGLPALRFPIVLDPDIDRVVDIDTPKRWKPWFTPEWAAAKLRDRHAKADKPDTYVYGPEYIERMHEALASPEMAAALGRLRDR